jgi:CheY-like chemotaxis protein
MATVLVVDDDENVRKTLSMMLRSLRLGVFAAPDAESGLNLLAAGDFDVALVDIFMPGMDGFATIREIRKLKPDLPIIAMSGRRFTNPAPGKPDFLGMAVRLGANEALQKPFAPADLCAAIGRCLAEATADAGEWIGTDNIVPFRTPPDMDIAGIASGGHGKP